MLPMLGLTAYMFFASAAPLPPRTAPPPQRDSGVVRESHETSTRGGSVSEDFVELEIFTGERLMVVRAPTWPWRRSPIPRPGDTVVVWTTPRGVTYRAWQMEVNGRRVFSETQARHRAVKRQSGMRMLALVLAGFTLFFGLLIAFTPGLAPVPAPPPRT
jgi:hypothetical protein